MSQGKAIMVLGTSSHVGKSLITAALCRIFTQRGMKVAPFKSQNMSLNSAVTPEGLEIGRAQALQAEAAGIPASVHMNPILIKPSGDCSSQVVVRGKIWGQVTAADYHQRRVEELMPVVRESYQILASEYDLIILEGAGSPAEINLKEHDIVNMRMAAMADAACLLVGDIDRGGVFASLLGTCELLDFEERRRIRGFCINKFRGDVSLLTGGVQHMEERLGKPCMGVIPYLPDLALEEEDSVGLPAAGNFRSIHDDRVRIAVLALPSFSNFTDFDALRAEPFVDLIFCRDAAPLSQADVVVLPGSKQTMSDLEWLKRNGFEEPIRHHDGSVIGICGGMQMLGQTIHDPAGIEQQGVAAGLGLLPIHTTMQKAKATRNSSGTIRATGQRIYGYEIHVGSTEYMPGAEPFAMLDSGEFDGCVRTNVTGTYLHGLFDDDTFRHAFLTSIRGAVPARLNAWKAQRERSLDRLAQAVSESLNINHMLSWVSL